MAVPACACTSPATPRRQGVGAGHQSAYEFNNVIFTAARLPQIIQNYQVGMLPSLVCTLFIIHSELARCRPRAQAS